MENTRCQTSTSNEHGAHAQTQRIFPPTCEEHGFENSAGDAWKHPLPSALRTETLLRLNAEIFFVDCAPSDGSREHQAYRRKNPKAYAPTLI